MLSAVLWQCGVAVAACFEYISPMSSSCLLEILTFWKEKPFHVRRHLLMLSFVVATLEAEQSLWCHCTLSHVRLCVFSEAGGRPGVWASLLLSLAALVKFSSITGWFNYFHPFTFNCVWQTLCSFETGCKVAKQSKEACQILKRVEGSYSELIMQANL